MRESLPFERDGYVAPKGPGSDELAQLNRIGVRTYSFAGTLWMGNNRGRAVSAAAEHPRKTSPFNCIGGNFGRVAWRPPRENQPDFAQEEHPMRRRDLLSAFGVAAGSITFGRLLTARAAEPSGANAAHVSSVPKPPYLVTLTDHLSIVFEADESALKSLLPPKLKPAAGNTVGLNMYRADPVGLAPYNASYLWINVDGVDSPDGSKGRWMVQGWYGPEPVPTAFRTQLGFPVELGETRLEHESNRIHAVLTRGGTALIDSTIALKEGGPAPVGALLNYPVSRQNLSGAAASTAKSDIAVNRIPFTGEVTAASPVSLEFHFRQLRRRQGANGEAADRCGQRQGERVLARPGSEPKGIGCAQVTSTN
jgi:hypothetical protein